MVSIDRPRGRSRSRGGRRPALAVLSVANSLVILDGLIVAVALPAIQDDLGFGGADLQWVVNAYVLCFGGGLLLGGRAADLVGRRRMAVAGLLAFAAGSVVAGLAPTAAVLVAGRALQGAAAAALDPALLALLVDEFPEGRERDRALGVWSAAGSLGIPAGALLGGLLTAALGWRWVLLAAVPVALAAAALVRLVLDERRDQTTPRRFDLPGAVTGTAGLALLIFAVTQVERLAGGPGGHPGGPSGLAALPRVAVPLAAAGVLLAAFVAVERRSPAPLVRLELLRRPGMPPATLAAATLPVGLGALLFLGTLHLQRVLGFTALETGLAYLVLSLPVVAASPAASFLAGRYGRRPVAAGGLLLQAAGLLLLLEAGPGDGFLTGVAPGFVLVGAGAPIAWVPLTAAAVDGAGDQSGLASGLFNTAQQVGNAVALAVLATVAAARTNGLAGDGPPTPVELVAGYHAGFLAAATLCLLGLLAALRLPRPAQAVPVSVPRPGEGRLGPARRRARSPRGRAAR
jgi:MFS family permease